MTCLALGFLFASTAQAQSTISDRPWELTSAHGMWAAFLPDYELGTNDSSGGPAYADDLDDVGYYTELKLVRRFLGTRTSFEVRGFYALADSSEDAGVANVTIPSPGIVGAGIFAGGSRRLESEVDHYGYDLTLRDTWRTRYGGLSAGCALSFMAFDQNFNASYGGNGILREELRSDLLGGKALVGWDGRFRGRPTTLDLAVGFYDMDTDYYYRETFSPAWNRYAFSRDSTTIETSWTTWTDWRHYQIGWRLSTTWFSDLPVIRHNSLGRATLDTDDAVTLNALIEILL